MRNLSILSVLFFCSISFAKTSERPLIEVSVEKLDLGSNALVELHYIKNNCKEAYVEIVTPLEKSTFVDDENCLKIDNQPKFLFTLPKGAKEVQFDFIFKDQGCNSNLEAVVRERNGKYLVSVSDGETCSDDFSQSNESKPIREYSFKKSLMLEPGQEKILIQPYISINSWIAPVLKITIK